MAEGNENIIDDRGTNNEAGRAIIQRLRDEGFDKSNEKLAVALGRPVEEIQSWINGAEPVDDDVVMKARGIATQRNINVE
jgi:plasmid maintenance system antidote protein VapI